MTVARPPATGMAGHRLLADHRVRLAGGMNAGRPTVTSTRATRGYAVMYRITG